MVGLAKQLAIQAFQLKSLDRSNLLSDADNQAKQERLRAELALVDSRQDHARIEYRSLSLQHEQERADLGLTVATLELAGVKSKELDIAKARLARLDTLQSLDRRNERPADRYVRGLNRTSGQINDALEGIQIDGLKALNDGLVDTITGAKSLGEAFSNFSNQIMADLLCIAIQQAIIKPLAGALFGGGAGGDGFLGSLFGRASGGYVTPGQTYRVNEGASPGHVEGFRPNVGGQIIPLGQMNARKAAPQSVGGVATIRPHLSDDIDARIEQVAGAVAIEVVRATGGEVSDLAARKTFAHARRTTL